jgi:hypothetical protein
MLALYGRRIKIHLVTEEEKDQAHGWATTLDEEGNFVAHYFEADQGRFLPTLTSEAINGIRVQLEQLGIFPYSITVRMAYNTFTYRKMFINRYHQAVAA